MVCAHKFAPKRTALMARRTSIFNVLPSSSGEVAILLYGEIGMYSDITDARVVAELLELSRTYSKIDVRINSIGGDVYTGLAIYQALHDSKADITIYIDGVAASMAAIIALCGKPLYMSPYAKLMLHNVSGGTYGNSHDLRQMAEQMEQLQGDLARMIAGRLQQSPEDIEAKYFNDGQDHWLTSQECLSMGLIDGVYSMDHDDDSPTNSSSAEEIRKYFDNRLNKQAQMIDNMALIDDIRKSCPAFSNTATEADVTRGVQDLYQQKQALAEENQTLRAQLSQLQAQETETFLHAAVEAGKITQELLPHYTALMQSNPDATRQLINSIPPSAQATPKKNPSFARRYIETGEGGAPSSTFANKTWDELDKAELLSEYKEVDFEGFKALFRERFGTEYKG